MDNFNLNKYFKNQYLSEGDISSSDIMPHKLQSHPDIKILIDTLSNFLNLDIEQRLGSGGYNGRSGYYIRMPYELRYWGDESEKAANNAFVKANKLSNEYNFELYDFTDWEEEPGERTWPANIGLFIQEKTLNERENKLFRVSKPRFIKDKNNLNFLNVYMDYDLGPGGASIALGKETMTGQIRRESAAEAIRQMENIARKLEDKFNIEDIEVTDLENGKVNLFAVSDDFIEMDLKSELSTALLNEEEWIKQAS